MLTIASLPLTAGFKTNRNFKTESEKLILERGFCSFFSHVKMIGKELAFLKEH